jgi:hypothetical protein
MARAIHTVRATSAALITLPKAGLVLVAVVCLGGATPGSFSLIYDGQSVAHFASPISRSRRWPVTWGPLGQNIVAAVQGFNGGIAAVELQFAEAPMGGQPISAYRAIRFARTDGGAVSANITVSYDVGPARPSAVLGLISASAGRAGFPTLNQMTYQTEAVPPEYPGDGYLPVPAYDDDTNSLTLLVSTDAASTSQFLVGY